MNSKRLAEEIYNFFYSNPSKGVDDIITMAQRSYDKAHREIVPQYKPRKIENLNSIPDEYKAKSRVVKRRAYRDQSTFADEDDDYWDK
ncbi:hypothetical protein [Lactobacillus sp.]|uniref:hypothetical protein n=1 Tax=Lactobacillus sp. TaxID=1591 RepID=UPI00199018DB|nr:hypothetical protein [Lactobacillus sp.]MBD5430500.1 hypothetical protein [Lactobacillus sp.]